MNTIQLDDLTVNRKERILPHGKRTIQQTWTKKRRKSSWQKTREFVRNYRKHSSSLIDSGVRKNRRNFWKLRRKSR